MQTPPLPPLVYAAEEGGHLGSRIMARVRHSTSSSEDVPGTCAVIGTTTKPSTAHMPGNTGAVRATTSTPPTVACDAPVLAAMASPHTGGSPFGSPTSAPSSAESRSGSPRAGFAHHGHSPRHHAATVIQAKQRQVAAKRRVAELKAAHDAVTACESDWAKAQQQAATRIQRAARRQHEQPPRRQQPTPPSLQPVPPQPAQGSVNITVESPSPRRTLTVVSHDTVGTRAPARRELFPETAQPPAPTKASAVRAPEAVHDGSDAPSLVAAPPASRRTRGQEPVEGPGQVHTSPVMHRGRRIKTKGTGTSCGSSTASSVASKNRSRPRGRDRQARARTRHRDTARDVSADSTPPQHKLDVDGSAGRRYRSFVVDDAASSGDEAAGARPARQSQPTVTPRTSHGRHSSCASSVSDGTSATAQSARSVASSNARGRASAAHTYQRLYQASQAKLKVLRAKHERESAQSAVRCEAHGLCRAAVATCVIHTSHVLVQALRKEVAALQAQHDRGYTAAQELRGQVDVLEKANKAMATRNHKLRKEVASYVTPHYGTAPLPLSLTLHGCVTCCADCEPRWHHRGRRSSYRRQRKGVPRCKRQRTCVRL